MAESYSLPGDPTEAGPDTRIDVPDPEWDDFMMFAAEELNFSRYRHRASTNEDRRLNIQAICRAEAFLASAKEALQAASITADERADAEWESRQEYGGNRCPVRE